MRQSRRHAKFIDKRAMTAGIRLTLLPDLRDQSVKSKTFRPRNLHSSHLDRLILLLSATCDRLSIAMKLRFHLHQECWDLVVCGSFDQALSTPLPIHTCFDTSMDKSKLELREDCKQRTTAGDQVLSWLRDASHQEYGDVVSELGDSAPREPATPSRRSLPVQYCEEVSPTNASFASDSASIFDELDTQCDVLIEDPFGDDVPDASSTHEQLHYPQTKVVQSIARSDLTVLDTGRSVAASLDSNEVAQEGANISVEAAVALIDPDEPRITRITSCTQCTVADLKCSRGVPSCSRCNRKGQGSLCLLQRARYMEELDEELPCSPTVLLRLKEDDEWIWQQKVKLSKEVCVCSLTN